MTRIRRGYLIEAMACIFILQAYLVMGAGAALAENRTKHPTTTASVTIKSKNGNAIFTAGQRFLITDSTSVFDAGGNQMEANDLPVPCKARIYYQPTMNGDPVALKIVVRRIIPVPSTSLPPPTPQ